METGRYVLHTVLIRIWSQLEGVMLDLISEYVQNIINACVLDVVIK
jgi:hypothetical protein